MNTQYFKFGKRSFRVVSHQYMPWFVAEDVCRILNCDKSALSLLKEEDMPRVQVGPHHFTEPLINIVDLYTLIKRVDFSDAKRFERWLVTTVLPAFDGVLPISSRPDDFEVFRKLHVRMAEVTVRKLTNTEKKTAADRAELRRAQEFLATQTLWRRTDQQLQRQRLEAAILEQHRKSLAKKTRRDRVAA